MLFGILNFAPVFVTAKRKMSQKEEKNNDVTFDERRVSTARAKQSLVKIKQLNETTTTYDNN